MRRILFLLVLLCAAPAVQAQEPTPTPSPSPAPAPAPKPTPTQDFPPLVERQQPAPTPDWLHPSDAEYQEAIDDGYSAKTPREALEGYIPIEISPIQRDPNASISVESPLHCAVAEGYFAAKDLADEPTVGEVRQLCDGLIGVYVLHFSRRLHANWPVMLQHKNTIYNPHSRQLGPGPKAKRYVAGSGPKVPGYMYDDIYTFKPEEAWTDEATVLWSDEQGENHSQKVDLSALAREEEKLRAEINQEP
jgi:hypothetical protein